MLLCCFGTLAAQEKSVPFTWALKTNPLQYLFKEANLSLEGVSGQNSVEWKVASVLPLPAFSRGLIYEMSKRGIGGKTHVMYRRYTKRGILFVGGGLSYKFWTYRNEINYPGEYAGTEIAPCRYESRYAHVPGLKVLMGIKAMIFDGKALIEPYLGAGARWRFGKTKVLTGGDGYFDCRRPDFIPFEEVESRFVPAIYFGMNCGLKL